MSSIEHLEQLLDEFKAAIDSSLTRMQAELLPQTTHDSQTKQTDDHSSKKERQTRLELIEYLVSEENDVSRDFLRHRLEKYSINLEKPLIIATIRAPGTPADQIIDAIENALGKLSLVAAHADHICAVFTADVGLHPETLAQELHEQKIHSAVAFSSPENEPRRFSMRHGVADAMSRTLVTLNRYPGGASRDTLGAIGILIGARQPALIEQIILDVLGPVLEYDAMRGTSLIETLEAFLTNGQYMRATATALHLHVNTLRQRLNKVDNLLGDNWRHHPKNFELAIAIELCGLVPEAVARLKKHAKIGHRQTGW